MGSKHALLRKLKREELIHRLNQMSRELSFLRKENIRIKEILNRKEYGKEYNQKPEVKEKRKIYNQIPEVKASKKAYNERPEVKARRKAHNQRPEVKERRNQRRRELYKRKQNAR